MVNDFLRKIEEPLFISINELKNKFLGTPEKPTALRYFPEALNESFNKFQSTPIGRTLHNIGTTMSPEAPGIQAQRLMGQGIPQDMAYQDAQRTFRQEQMMNSVMGATGPMKNVAKNIGKNIANKSIGSVGRELKFGIDQLVKTDPVINLKRSVPITDIYGNKNILSAGEALTPYELKGNKYLLKDGEPYIVSKNQFQNIKGNAVSGEAKEFAPELKETEETIRGSLTKNQQEVGQKNVEIMKQRQKAIELEMDRYGDNLPDRLKNEYIDLGDKIEYLERGLVKTDNTKFSQYQLPGGKNYKEVLIKAPQNKVSFEDYMKESAVAGKKLNKEQLANWKNQYEHFYLGGAKGGQTTSLDFKSSHWDEPNVISHLRLNERTYQGKKVTFMEELQSDWAREGRSKGFIENMTPEEAAQVAKNYKYTGGGNPPTTKGTIPNNPLLKNWQELSVKRALKEAVANNSDYLAWISGEQTSARYNLATYLESAKWGKSDVGDNFKSVILQPKDSSSKIALNFDKRTGIINYGKTEWQGKKLDEVLGKGLADKIIEKESGQLSGEGLSFGGEWAKNLYDKQVKNIVEDVTGHKVETLDMGLPVEGKDSDTWLTPSKTGFGHSLEVLNRKKIKVGMDIARNHGHNEFTHYIITNVLGDGKFKAVSKAKLNNPPAPYNKSPYNISSYKDVPDGMLETFDISAKKSSGQQAIKITPEIRSKVKGESLPLKKASGVSPFKDNKKRELKF